ncbi:MAG: macro domain-containing protein [Desulfobacter sp.]|nr:macro domain-containing protein [Desulfobacter sp.]WDP88060.1 MAG: macro domain-containing protein [Desulfobacter sp.]
MKCITGDLIELTLAGKFDLIIHGCNCFCAMGAGIARQIRDYFPQAFQADQSTASGEKTKLGTYSKAVVETPNNKVIIINGYTQFHYSGKGVLADYKAIETLFSQLKTDFSGKRMGYPKIGAGLGKGNWEVIQKIIDQALADENHTLVVR